MDGFMIKWMKHGALMLPIATLMISVAYFISSLENKVRSINDDIEAQKNSLIVIIDSKNNILQYKIENIEKEIYRIKSI